MKKKQKEIAAKHYFRENITQKVWKKIKEIKVILIRVMMGFEVL